MADAIDDDQLIFYGETAATQACDSATVLQRNLGEFWRRRPRKSSRLEQSFSIPVLHKAGRGMPFTYDLSYDSSVWYPTPVNGVMTWQPVSNFGWRGQTEVAVGYVSKISHKGAQCPPGDGGFLWYWDTYAYHDQFGVTHPFSGTATADCNSNDFGFTSSATDGSGYGIIVADGSFAVTITSPSGQTRTPPGAPTGTGTNTDANGNQITVSAAGVFTDTLGTTALSVTGGAPNPLKFTYTAPSGTAAFYSVNYSSYNIKTNFTCSGISQYTATGVYLVSSISLPDGSSYGFTYEATPGFSGYYTGRLAQVTLPTGGTITYTYNYADGNNGIICADGSTDGLTRTLNPGGQWTYTRSGSGNSWTTTVTDPQTPSNQTVISFQKDSAASNRTNNFYETQRQVYQGSTSGTLLGTTITCYNGNSVGTPANCVSATAVATPIARRSVFTYIPDSSGLQAETDTSYISGSSFVTEQDNYDYGSQPFGSLLRKTLISYSVYGNTVRPTSVLVKDGGGTTRASTNYYYDQTAVTTTSGTPKHIAITIGRGNLTEKVTQTSGSVNIYRKFTYYDTGTMKTSTGASTSGTTDGPTTTYNYDNSGTPPHACGNSFITSITEPLSLSRSMTWDCTGGVMTSATDENGKTTSVTYNDPDFWRPAKSFDQLSNETDISYLSPTATESSMLFNGNASVVDHRIRLDGFARPIVSQTLQGPGASNYDSVETDYDVAGRIAKTTLPYSAAGGTLCSGTCPGTSPTYDALGRVLTSTDGGGGSVTLSYSKNDVYQTIGPQPSGESNTKRKQFEYDALGQLTSVCEVTGGTGSGTCAQNSSPQPTGYWTKYTYNALGNLTNVTQNAQAAAGSQETRAYTFDMVGRMTAETNPETGTVTYSYDSLTSDASCGTVTSAGDLLKKVDAMGNVTCFQYDNLHRVKSITYPTGTYSADKKYFVYDSATVNGTTMSNAKTRLAEAYTCTTCPGTKKTDLGFSYSARGEITDVWESTTNSGGYYHINGSYWANGALNVLNGGTNQLPGLPAITYGADGEGRASTVSAASGQNPVTAVTYTTSGTTEPIGSLTHIAFGSSDSDDFTYDTNTGRITEYKFSMGATPKTLKGDLTWNANGTLKQLVIADQIVTANSQTCTFTHDDLARLAGLDGSNLTVNCGGAWSQAFTLDPFGNLSKSGSASFLPTYSSPPTNQFSQIPGGPNGVSNYYDANGNLTNDLGHTYTWDANGKMLSVDGSAVTMIYDAIGRMAEQTRGSAHTQIVYSPQGTKLALMNGQTLVDAFVALPGATAVYASSGLAYYRHADHLGSSRLATTPSRTKYYDVAYAPYSEDYGGSGTQDLSFTSQNQDTVGGGWAAGLYDFLFREYRPAQGRFISPDPALSRAIDAAKPQTWNRYAYVMNDPTGAVDPLGLFVDAGHPAHCEYNGSEQGGGPCPEDMGNTIMGNNIFDALEGAPGTFIDLSAPGKIGFGFSIDLWMATENFLDEANATYRAAKQAGLIGQFNSQPHLPVVTWEQGLGEFDMTVMGLVPEKLRLDAQTNLLVSQLPQPAIDDLFDLLTNGPHLSLSQAITQILPNYPSIAPDWLALAAAYVSYGAEYADVFQPRP